MTFKQRMNDARKRLEQQSTVTTTTKPTKVRITDYEYCKSIVDLAIAKLKDRECNNGNQDIGQINSTT